MNKGYSCIECGSPPSNTKDNQDGDTSYYKCSNHNITTPSGIECDGLIPVNLREIYMRKIADEPCVT